jgi:hypothetical protein
VSDSFSPASKAPSGGLLVCNIISQSLDLFSFAVCPKTAVPVIYSVVKV